MAEMRTRRSGRSVLAASVAVVLAGGRPAQGRRRACTRRVLISALTTVVCCLALPVANAAAGTAPQSISWSQQGPYMYGQGINLYARASSGLTVSYSAVSGPCWMSGSRLMFRIAGSCVVKANQGGSAYWAAAPTVQQTITATAYVARSGSILTAAVTAGAPNTTGLVSTCPEGTYVVGIRPYVMPITSWAAGAQAICGIFEGATAGFGNAIGGFASSGPSTDLVCPVGELAVGVYGRAGSYVDGMGVRCAVPGIAGVDGPYGGGAGGTAKGPFDCRPGSALIGLAGSELTSAGSDALMSLQGICSAASPVATATGALTGTGPTNVVGAVSICRSGTFVTTIMRDAISPGWTGGVHVRCGGWFGNAVDASTIGGRGAVSSAGAYCYPPEVAVGLHGRAGTWLDAVGIICAAPGTSSIVPLIGGSGGSPQGPFTCPVGYALIGVQGSYNSTLFSGQDSVATLKGICEKYPTTFGSARSKNVRYKGSDRSGAVRFRMVIRHASVLGKAVVYQYTLYHLSFATSCSPSGRRIPGNVTATGRVSSRKQQRFTLRTKRYRLTGRISGPLAKPKVRGTLKVLSGACGREVLPFRAKIARRAR
jgi:hypothetical protein